MRRATALVLAALSLAACGGDEGEKLPAACRDATPEQVTSALESAPAAVRVSGVPLSDCFNRGAGTGDVQAVGAVFIDVAEQLAAEARTSPGGHAETRLGYLLGAADRGAGRTQGIHTELLRRLRNTAAGIDPHSPEFARGHSAGLEGG